GDRKSRWSEMSRQRVLLRTAVPVGALMPPLFHLSLFLAGSDGFNFVYNYLPEETRAESTLLFFLFALAEFFLVLIWFSSAGYAQLLELMMFEFLNCYLRCGLHVMKTEEMDKTSTKERMFRGYRRLREVQIYIQNFNIVSKGPILAYKFLFLVISISLGFYGFKNF
ncbi:unnamed protein product, partial [Allacma fusca]